MAAPAKKIPYWVSITESEARMRVGPSLDYPANWIYRRKGLPLKVVMVLDQWRKVEDSEGAQGWMHVRLLSDKPAAIVTAEMAEMRSSATDQSRLLFRAEKGVVGRIVDCNDGWCQFDVDGSKGYVRASSLWGAVR